MHDTIPETCDKCGCTPTVDPETDVIDLIQVCGITLGVQLDREHWLCSTCAAEFGGGTDYDEEQEKPMPADLLIKLSRLYTLLGCIRDCEETSIDTDGADPQEIAEQVLAWANLNGDEEDYLFEQQGRCADEG